MLYQFVCHTLILSLIVNCLAYGGGFQENSASTYHLSPISEYQTRLTIPDATTFLPDQIQIIETSSAKIKGLKDWASSMNEKAPAKQWFMDHNSYYLKELSKMKSDLKNLQKENLPYQGSRVFEVVYNYVQSLNFEQINMELLLRHLDSMQPEEPFTLSELQTIPTFLKLSILLRFSDQMSSDKLSKMRSDLTDRLFPNSRNSINVIDKTDFDSFNRRLSRSDKLLAENDIHFASMDNETQNRYRNAVNEISIRSKRSEKQVLEAAFKLAKDYEQVISRRTQDQYLNTHPKHVGYYLIGEGRSKLHQELGIKLTFVEKVKSKLLANIGNVFLGSIFSLTAVITIGAIYALTLYNVPVLTLVLAFPPLLIAFHRFSSVLVEKVVSKFVNSSDIILPKMNFWKGIPDEHRTMVVYHAMFSSYEEIDEIFGRIENAFVNNQDKNIYIGVMSDPLDSDKKELSEEEIALNTYAREKIETLNQSYKKETGHSPFFYFNRERVWNERTQKYIAHERKRGKLELLNEWLRSDSNSEQQGQFSDIVGSVDLIKGTKHVITLDDDSELPPGMARRFIETSAHPLNLPVIDKIKKRVSHGYGMIYPWLGLLPTFDEKKSDKTLYRQMQLHERGQRDLSIYQYSFPDLHQWLFKEGTFTGKGIYNVDTYNEVLTDKLPNDRLLSHDQIEGWYLRAGLATDMVILEGTISDILSDYKRFSRWTRGDYQDLPWATNRVPSAEGDELFSEKNTLSFHHKWKMASKILNTLHTPSVVLLLLGAWFITPQLASPLSVAILALAVFPRIPLTINPKIFIENFSRHGPFILFDIILLMSNSLEALKNVFSILGDRLITQPHLEWMVASQLKNSGDRRSAKGIIKYLLPTMLITSGLAIAVVVQSALLGSLSMATGPLIILALWLFAPLLVYKMAKPEIPSWMRLYPILWKLAWLINNKFTTEAINNYAVKNEERLTDEGDLALLNGIVDNSWNWYREFVTEDHHWLPPDHSIHSISETPVVKPYTSPTNIGMYLISIISSSDLSVVTLEEARKRARDTLLTMEQLEMWNGHLYNYYYTQGEQALNPDAKRYVSTVDSGNLAASLLVVAEYFKEIDPEISSRADRLFQNMDFAKLYNDKKGLFYHGYSRAESSYSDEYFDTPGIENTIKKGKYDENHYDKLISEARIASFIAIAKGDVSPIHWFHLQTNTNPTSSGKIIMSWSGTLFEYLLPTIFMDEKKHSPTFLGTNNQRAVSEHIKFSQRQDWELWGISESAYDETNEEGHPFYKAMGVPSTSIDHQQNDVEIPHIIAPYGSALAIDYNPRSVLQNLGIMKERGIITEWGLPDAVHAETLKPIETYYAHHTGFTIAALTNHLRGGLIRDLFHQNPLIRAATPLLNGDAPISRSFNTERFPQLRFFGKEALLDQNPHVNGLSNGAYTAVVPGRGGGASKYQTDDGKIIHVTRDQPNGALGEVGKAIYIRDTDTGETWSLQFEPIRSEPDVYKFEHSSYYTHITNENNGIRARARVFVPEDNPMEVWEIALENLDAEKPRNIEMVSYLEWLLSQPGDDRRFPISSKLFFKTDFDPETNTIFALNTKSGVLGFHSINMRDGTDSGFNTDRVSFVGSGRSLHFPLADMAGKEGHTFDSIAALSGKISLDPRAQTRMVIMTGVASHQEEAREIIERYSQPLEVQKALLRTKENREAKFLDLGLQNEERKAIHILTGAIYSKIPQLMGSIEHRRSNQKGQKELWKYGISGDKPIILVNTSSSEDIKHALSFIKIANFLDHQLEQIELVILNNAKNDTDRRLINQAIEQYKVDGKVVLVDGQKVDAEGDQALLGAWAHVSATTVDDLITKFENIPAKDLNGFSWPEPKQKDESSKGPIHRVPGKFQKGGSEYVITTPHTPTAWSHILSNPDYGTLVHNRGSLYSWKGNAQANRLTPYEPDPVTDISGKAFYIKDVKTGRTFSPTYFPLRDEAIKDKITFGMGYAVYNREFEGLNTELTAFVPLEESVEVWDLTLENTGDEEAEYEVTNFFKIIMGEIPEHTLFTVQPEYDPETDGLLFSRKMSVFSDEVAFASTNLNKPSYGTDSSKFFGANRGVSNPVGVEQGELDKELSIDGEAAASFQGRVRVKPGEKVTVTFTLGQTSPERSREIMQKYKSPEQVRNSLDATKKYWKDMMESLVIQTNDSELDAMVNYWLKYQAVAGHIYARTGYNQSGGAVGFRDQLQSALVGLYVDPDILKKQIILHSEHQFKEGDVQHWWHTHNNNGVRSHISDNLVWLGYALYQYVKSTGDESILDIETNFIEGDPIPEGEEGIVYEASISKEKGTILDHVIRALDFSLGNISERGLPLIGAGDWNDGLDRMGLEGKGESIWLGFFLYDVLVNMADILDMRPGFEEKKEQYLTAAKDIQTAIEVHAWDGDWYVRAYNDEGKAIGVKDNEEWQIDAIPQAWAAISGAGNPERTKTALAAVDEHLVQESMIQLAKPAFTLDGPINPGKMGQYPPGVRENAGQYTHGVSWLIPALGKLGEFGKAYEYFQKLMPYQGFRVYDNYIAEPYYVAADIYSGEDYFGRSGWSIYTGAASWLFRGGLEGVLGFELRDGKISLTPTGGDLHLIDAKSTLYSVSVKVDGKLIDTLDRSAGKIIDEAA